MKRSNWPRVLKKDYIARDFELDSYSGQMSLSILRNLTAPLTIHYPFGDVLIADTNYSWLQIALKDQFFWFTAMYDDQGRFIQLYVDITAGNCFADPENPCFEDMYLDIDVRSDGTISILDQDELDEALACGAITEEAYRHAQQVCRHLYDYLRVNKDAVLSWCTENYRELIRQIAP